MSFWHPDIVPEREPLRFLLKRGSFHDPARARDIPFKVYHPAEGGPYPLIVWSHGLGGTADGAAFLARFMASHGYVVLNVQHPGTDSSLWEGKPGHPWDNIRKAHIPHSASLDRFADISFALDRFPDWAQENIPATIDFAKTGMSGHSYGALTTQVISGQLFPDEAGIMRSYADKRPVAGIMYSPIPVHLLNEGQTAGMSIYGGMSIPLLHMTGTKDHSPMANFGYERRADIFNHAGGPDQHLLALENADHMVFAGSRGKLEDAPDRALQEERIKMTSLAFWESYLRDDEDAFYWLTGDGLRNYLGPGSEYKYRA